MWPKNRYGVLAAILFASALQQPLAPQTTPDNNGIQRQLAAARRSMRLKDWKSALLILQPLAAEGNKWGEYYLGLQYYYGEALTKDYGQASALLRKAAEQGLAAAQYQTGIMYARGEGVKRDDKEAADWFEKSAEQDYIPAEYVLGWAYAHGLGVLLAPDLAIMWYQRAAEGSEDRAQYELGEIYLNGWFVKRDLIEGYKWLAIAKELGNEAARGELEAAEKLLSAAQIKEAKIAAYVWVEKNVGITKQFEEDLKY